MRLFAALALPETAADHLEMALRSVDDAAPEAGAGRGRPALRWVHPELRHITLAFYGEVPAGAVEELTTDLEAALLRLHPFDVRIRGAGVFTGRTLWTGVQQIDSTEAGPAAPGLIELMRVCESVGADYVRSPESLENRARRRAHVTVARARDRKKGEAQLRDRAEAMAVYEGPSWTVDQAQLIVSELGQGRGGSPLYTTVAEMSLGG